MFTQIDISRREITRQLNQAKRSELGQFFTPYSIAQFMASLFEDKGQKQISLLDAGAGIGSLSIAFLEKFASYPRNHLDIFAFELDDNVAPILKENLEEFADQLISSGVAVSSKIIEGDFIREAVISYLTGKYKPVDYAILNPPYRKINSDSDHRLLLRKLGIETVNLYSAFVALAVLMLKEGGELVAIIPRSFCNGLYYRPFREFLLEKTTLKQIHIFDSRTKAFKDDGVLQENIIIHIAKGIPQTEVKISSSTDSDFSDYGEFTLPYNRVVANHTPDKFIHIPSNEEISLLSTSDKFTYSLVDLGIEVSTGPVVDFRIKEHLQKEPIAGTAPLLYPAHFGQKNISWPKADFKKSNAVNITPETQRQLYPTGYYTLVRRFSAKEEKRRIVARVLTPVDVTGEYVGFENHLNVFHHRKKGLPRELSLGLAVYLNSTLIDEYFRQFNGHTQVNATDLRLLKYPSKQVLTELGEWAENLQCFDQVAIDSKISSLL